MPDKDPKTEAERIARWDAEVVSNMMSTPQGRFLMERFLDFCSEGQELYRDDGDALGMAKRDGSARAGRWWRIMIEEHCPDRYLQMVRERRSRIARISAELRSAETAREPETDDTLSPIEAMADEQRRLAAEEAERNKPKKV
jgi:hypothetical protein